MYHSLKIVCEHLISAETIPVYKSYILCWESLENGQDSQPKESRQRDVSSPLVPPRERVDYTKILIFRVPIYLYSLQKSNHVSKMLYYKPFSLRSSSSSDLLSLPHVWFQVSVHLEASPAFQAVPVEKEDSYCICENGRQTVSWAVTPKSLGRRQIPRNYSILLKVCIAVGFFFFFLAVGFLYPVLLLLGKDAFSPRQ